MALSHQMARFAIPATVAEDLRQLCLRAADLGNVLNPRF
jgi:hypothetical protein